MGFFQFLFKSKETTETSNSILWFIMDACWMFGLNSLSMSLALPTLLTGLWLISLEKRRDARCVDTAMFFWLLMNVGWMYAEILKVPEILIGSKFAFAFGMVFLIMALRVSTNWRVTVSYFKKLRIGQIGKVHSTKA